MNKTIEERVEELEQEVVEFTNALYEVENRLQSQIDNFLIRKIKDGRLTKDDTNP